MQFTTAASLTVITFTRAIAVAIPEPNLNIVIKIDVRLLSGITSLLSILFDKKSANTILLNRMTALQAQEHH
jgi:hypothetical protein